MSLPAMNISLECYQALSVDINLVWGQWGVSKEVMYHSVYSACVVTMQLQQKHGATDYEQL